MVDPIIIPDPETPVPELVQEEIYDPWEVVGVTNLRWGPPDPITMEGFDFPSSSFTCFVVFKHLMGVHDYSAGAYDVAAHGRDIYRRGAVLQEWGEILPHIPYVWTPLDLPLNAERFYGWLDTLAKFDDFAAALNTVTPSSRKVLCTNQFNNSTLFTWDMALMQSVAPLVWGATWETDLAESWMAAARA